MPYYVGDYYRGDYYRGDPGFLSTLGKVGKGLGRVAAAAAGGILGRGVAGAVGGAVAEVGTRMVPAPPMIPTIGFMPQGKQGPDVSRGYPGAVPEPGARGGIQRFLPGGQSGYTAAPPGYHVNRAYMDYMRSGGRRQNPFNARSAVNVIVKNRRMNPLNPRALKRALARQRSAVALFKAVLRGTGFTVTRHGLGGKRRGRRVK